MAFSVIIDLITIQKWPLYSILENDVCTHNFENDVYTHNFEIQYEMWWLFKVQSLTKQIRYAMLIQKPLVCRKWLMAKYHLNGMVCVSPLFTKNLSTTYSSLIEARVDWSKI